MGVVLDLCSRLRVSSSWGRRRSHWCMGKSVATPAIILKNFCLEALMVPSATLR